MKPSLTLNLALACCLGLAASCASTTGMSSSKNTNRGRSGQISAKQFIEADWKSSGVNGDVAADEQLALTLMVIDATPQARFINDPDAAEPKPDPDFKPDPNYEPPADIEMMRYLESELGGLGRFPVQPLTSYDVSSMMRELHQLGEVDLPDGSRRQVNRRYVITFRYKRGAKHYTPNDIPDLNPTSNAVHRYWLEGDLQVLEVTQNPADDRIVYADRTFRTTPNFKNSMLGAGNNKVIGGHRPNDVTQRENVHRDLMQDVLFRISKEIYTKLCVQGRVTGAYAGGGSVQLGTDLTSRAGVQPGQLMFVYSDLGSLRVPVAKAIATDLDGNLEILQWRPNDREADAFRADPEAYLQRADRKVVVQTEKLAVSDVDSERLQELERLSEASLRDQGWFSQLTPGARKQIERAVTID